MSGIWLEFICFFWRLGRTCGVLACDMRCQRISSVYELSIDRCRNHAQYTKQKSYVLMQGVLQPSRRMPDPVHLLPQYFHPRRYPRIARCTCLSSSAPRTMTVPRVNHHFSTSNIQHLNLRNTSVSLTHIAHSTPFEPCHPPYPAKEGGNTPQPPTKSPTSRHQRPRRHQEN